MADEPEVIRDQMQETRTALTEKLEALESQVSSTVQNATAAVTETVQAVKESVTDTVGTVKDTMQETVSTVKESVRDAFDLPGHVERHPWVAMLGSVAVGYVAGRLLQGVSGGVSETARQAPPQYNAFKEPQPEPAKSGNGFGNGAHREEKESSSEPGLLGSLANAFSGELDTLKNLGISAVAGVVRDMVTQSVHGEMGNRLRQWMDDVTERMGAKPFNEPLLSQEDEGDPARCEPKRGSTVNVRRETLPRM
jgi:ElaB/YqjD/DUF883 family membrane-anchored ribosome-binding protein